MSLVHLTRTRHMGIVTNCSLDGAECREITHFDAGIVKNAPQIGQSKTLNGIFCRISAGALDRIVIDWRVRFAKPWSTEPKNIRPHGDGRRRLNGQFTNSSM